MNWFVYIVKARDGSLYTGISNNVERRVKEHNNKKGSKSLLGKLPVTLVYTEKLANRKTATKRELEIKHLKREEKIQLVLTGR
ncbi:MAG: GIY-YIG nuclease family protein [Candidatus Levyibacteriota bacterium]